MWFSLRHCTQHVSIQRFLHSLRRLPWLRGPQITWVDSDIRSREAQQTGCQNKNTFNFLPIRYTISVRICTQEFSLSFLTFYMGVTGNRVLRRIFGARSEKISAECRKLHSYELHNLYCTSHIIRVIRSRWHERPFGRVRRREIQITLFLYWKGHDVTWAVQWLECRLHVAGFTSSQVQQRFRGPHSLLFSGYWGSFAAKRPERKTNH